MGKKEPYIDKHNLGERVLGLSFGGMTDTRIAEQLTSEGHKISQPTVTRWLQAKREEMGPQVRGIMQDHLQRKLPRDLEVLEEMEVITFDWAKEEKPALVERLMDPAWCAAAYLRWKASIVEAKEEEQQGVMRLILKEAMGRVTEFFNVRREKLNFMKSTRDDIALKLQYSGVIEGAEKGNIYIVTSKKEQGPQGQKGGESKPRLQMVLKGPKDAK